MARSFWSKRKDNLQTVDGYVKATDSVSRPTALLLTVLGILVVGGLLFGVFAGTRWIISKVSEDDTANTASTGQSTPAPASSPNTQPTQTNPTSGSVTATSSASTTTPSTPAPAAPTTVVAAASTDLPNTGPTQNYLIVFMATTLLGYAIYHKKSLKN